MNTKNNGGETVTVAEAAKALGVSRDRVYQLVKSLEAYKASLGAPWSIPKTKLNELIQIRRAETPDYRTRPPELP
ncbi:helix-turn-helix domain-containing protein [Antrihabitans sp. YC2-6]|uniref:helix-turn-helix domain-containing protein n=1 Tax=Antrihabitans sp. YC2-6 TaxID=2799498 RepID=UPI0035A952F4